MIRTDQGRTFILDAEDLAAIECSIDTMQESFDSVESEDFAEACELEAANLPRRLRRRLNGLINGSRNDGYLTVSGFRIDDDRIGPSPQHWDVPWSGRPFLREEIYQCLVSSALGSIFGWRTQENGRFLRHIVPVESEKYEQLGTSSATMLLYHIEEAFHPARADILVLMCYRNAEEARTEIVFVDDLSLEPDVVNVLRQERFIVEPDKSHLPAANKSDHWNIDAELFGRVLAMMSAPKPCAVLSGSSVRPRLLVDEAFMHAVPGDSEASAALDVLHAELARRSQSVVMKPGELLVLNNRTVAHGRSIYTPDYGPKQRWLRRVNIANGRGANVEFQEPDNYRVRL